MTRSAALAVVDEPHPIILDRWADPVVESLGWRTHSPYVEQCWTWLLGPTSILILRHLDHVIDVDYAPGGILVDARDVASHLGLGISTRPNSTLMKTMTRLCHFAAARRLVPDVDAWQVRISLAPLSRSQLHRAPASAVTAHHALTRYRQRGGC